MDRFRRVPIFVVVATLSLAASSLAGQSKATTTSQLTPAEMETFLQKARIMGKRMRVPVSQGHYASHSPTESSHTTPTCSSSTSRSRCSKQASTPS